MSTATQPLAVAQPGFVQDLVGPSFADLRPGKPETSATFPASNNLSARMADADLAHSEPAVVHVLAVAAGVRIPASAPWR